MILREHVGKDHDCAGGWIIGQHAWGWIVEAEEREICELRSISPAKLPRYPRKELAPLRPQVKAAPTHPGPLQCT